MRREAVYLAQIPLTPVPHMHKMSKPQPFSNFGNETLFGQYPSAATSVVGNNYPGFPKETRKLKFRLCFFFLRSVINRSQVLNMHRRRMTLNFITKTKKSTSFGKSMFRWPRNGRSRCKEFSNLSGEEFFFPLTAAKT